MRIAPADGPASVVLPGLEDELVVVFNAHFLVAQKRQLPVGAAYLEEPFLSCLLFLDGHDIVAQDVLPSELEYIRYPEAEETSRTDEHCIPVPSVIDKPVYDGHGLFPVHCVCSGVRYVEIPHKTNIKLFSQYRATNLTK